jgi:carboxylesterase type B
MLWVHGGGYILLEAYLDDAVCRRMADEFAIPIVSAEYRSAPKHPFLAALYDCRQSGHGLRENAEESDVDPRRSVIAGESAGAVSPRHSRSDCMTRTGFNRSLNCSSAQSSMIAPPSATT